MAAVSLKNKQQQTISIRQSQKLQDTKTGGVGEHKRLPFFPRLLYNYIRAKYRDWKNKGKRVTFEHYTYRLDICSKCTDYKNEDRCTHPDCGCYLSIKAWYASERCPDNNKWEEVPEDAIES